MGTTMQTTPLLTFLLILFGFIVSCGLIDGNNGDPDDGGGISPPSPDYPKAYAEPSVSPDGSKLLFVRNKVTRITKSGFFTVDPDSSGIWMADITGRNMKLLIQSQNVGTPSFSPDMNWILFEGGAQIYKVPFAENSVNMDSLVQLTVEGRNFFPDWSPDSEWIAYDNTTCGTSSEPIPENSCGILLTDKNGSSKELIVSGRMPDWSSDSENLVYVGLGNEIYVLNLSDKSELRLTTLNNSDSNPISNRFPKYSPSGTKIAFQSDIQIRTIDIDGQNIWELTSDGGVEPTWTLNHKIIYVDFNYSRFSIDNGTLWIMNADGSNKQQLTQNHGLILEN